jgi:hypothetical protein
MERKFFSNLQEHPAVWCAVLFSLGVLPVIQSVYTYHGDELFYNDSAILMRQSGNESAWRWAWQD